LRGGSNTHPLGAKFKVANGVVAVGLPHRNYSVLNQTQINQRKVKGRIRMELRIREVDEGGGGLSFRHSPRKRGIQKYKQQRRGASTSGLTSAAQ